MGDARSLKKIGESDRKEREFTGDTFSFSQNELSERLWQLTVSCQTLSKVDAAIDTESQCGGGEDD